jgi:hypothetical protein
MTWLSERGMPHSEWLDWDHEDRAKQLAFLAEANARCDMCGTAEWEWKENPHAYEPVDEFCRGCYMKSVFQDQESGGLPGTNVKLVPFSPLRQAERVVRAKKQAQMLKRDREKEV